VSSAPIASTLVSVKSGQPRSRKWRRMRASIAAPTRCAFAPASMPPIMNWLIARKPSAKVMLTLAWSVGGRPRAPRTSTRSGPACVSVTPVKSHTTSGRM